MDVKPIPGLEHLPYAEVWLHAADERAWREASEQARALGKTGLEVWTTDRTPAVAAFLAARGYEEVRRYLITELEVARAADLGPPALPVEVRSGPAERLYEIALESYRDQPGRSETRLSPFDRWRTWGLGDVCFVALEGGRVLGYGILRRGEDAWRHDFLAVARDARGRGVGGAIKRAQIRWATEHGVRALRTATEARLTQMRALNERFGYRLLYSELVLRGPLAP